MASWLGQLEANRISDLPPSCYYLPNFITSEEEQMILKAIYDLSSNSWTNLSRRRLLSLPSQLTGTKRDTLLASSLPLFLEQPIIHRFKEYGVFETSPHQAPNHCLINEYEPGQGIMPHEDGPIYYPITATVSLRSYTVLEIYNKNESGERNLQPTWRILQEPRSLLITGEDMYATTLHGISELASDETLDTNGLANWNLLGDQTVFESGEARRATRLSLTYRDVIKVSKLGGVMKFMSKR